MEARSERTQRFSREDAPPRLTEATGPVVTDAIELDAGELLARLEAQAAENGRLEARVQALERAVSGERDARRRLAATLKKERRAAAAIHEQSERYREEHAASVDELERLRQASAVSDLHVQQAWARVAETEQRLAYYEQGFWRRLFRRSPERG